MTLSELLEVGRFYNFEYNYMWADITLDSRVDKNVLINEIINRCSRSTPLINTYQAFRNSSNAFFDKWDYQIRKLMDTQEFEYNPIWNKDGKRDHTLTYEKDNEQNTGDDYSENRNDDISATVNNDVSAYNANDYQPHDKNVTTSNENEGTTSTRDINRKENEGYVERYSEIEQGNIGVTTTQTMIQEERALYEFNIYEWIVDKYENELFLRVW